MVTHSIPHCDADFCTVRRSCSSHVVYYTQLPGFVQQLQSPACYANFHFFLPNDPRIASKVNSQAGTPGSSILFHFDILVNQYAGDGGACGQSVSILTSFCPTLA